MLHYLVSTQYKFCDLLGGYSETVWNSSMYEQTPHHLRCNDHDNPSIQNENGHWLTVHCQKPFKFSINMENTATFGYTSEKIYSGLMAETVPIYFGNKEIADIVNLDRIIFCDIPDDVLVAQRLSVKENVTVNSKGYIQSERGKKELFEAAFTRMPRSDCHRRSPRHPLSMEVGAACYPKQPISALTL